MIKSFQDKDTEQLFQRQFMRRFPPDLHRLAWRKLVQIDAAERLDDLRIPPGNQLERLLSDRVGDTLLEEFLKPLGITQYRLAKDIGVHPRRVNEIVHGQRAITADTALRLSRYFGLSERYWLNLQARYDLEVEKKRLEGRLVREVRVFSDGTLTAVSV